MANDLIGEKRSRGGPVTHGMSRSPEFRTWCNMRARCNNPKNTAYKHYGEKGITVCARWDESFEAFIADMGPRPSLDHTIERINNDHGYGPDNCRWATRAEQSENRSMTKWITFDGETRPIAFWIRALGVDKSTVYRKAKRLGVPVQQEIIRSLKERKANV